MTSRPNVLEPSLNRKLSLLLENRCAKFFKNLDLQENLESKKSKKRRIGAMPFVRMKKVLIIIPRAKSQEQ